MTVPVRLNRALQLEEPSATPDGSGGFSESWTVLGTLWGEVRARSGREQSGIGRARSVVPYIITVRAAPEGAPERPRAGQRFRDGSRLFRILAVADDDPSGRFLSCFAEEEVTS